MNDLPKMIGDGLILISVLSILYVLIVGIGVLSGAVQ